MAVLTTGNTFASGDQVTAATLNSAVNDAEFAAGAVDNTSTQLSGTSPQQIIVKDLGISTGKIANGAVTTAKIASDVVINTSGSITGAAGSFTTLSASGGLTGNVTGNVTGNLAGNVTGNVTGDVTGNISGNVTGGTGAFTTLTASDDVNFDSGTLFVDASADNVGIGTTSPSYKLEVNGDTVIGDDTTGNARINSISGDSTSGSGNVHYTFKGNEGTGMRRAAANTLTFDTTSQERVRINEFGNVGIGTTSPSQLLDVNGQARIVGNLFVGTDDTTPNGMIEVYGGGTGQNEGGEIRLRTGADYDTTYNHYYIDAYQDDLRIGRDGIGADVTVSSDGYVGIGDAIPSYKLDVNGTGRFVNDLTLDEELIHNLSGAGSLPGYSAGTFGAVLEDGGANGSSLYMSRKNSWALYLATDTTLNAQSDKVVQFADLNGQSGDQDNVVGSITITSSSTAYNTSSDYRLKENTVDIADGISRLKQLKPYRFNFTRDPSTTVDGFFAHEVSSVVPESISGEKDQVDSDGNPVYQGIDQSKLVPLLTAALQEAVAKIEALEARVQTLEG